MYLSTFTFRSLGGTIVGDEPTVAGVFAMELNREQISDYLDITPPFLMLDEIRDLVFGDTATGIRQLGADDWFFACHLERHQVMPGTLLIETMLQTLAVVIYTTEGHKGKPSYVTNIKTKLLSQAGPGESLECHAKLRSFRRGLATGAAHIMVNDRRVCEGQFRYASPHLVPHPASRGQMIP